LTSSFIFYKILKLANILGKPIRKLDNRGHMGGEIIADKFALLKTRGSNGVAYTHIVEDILLGQRAVVKTSDKLGLLALEYLKTANMAREMDIPGMLMPIEGGILEGEEAGYYLVFPEMGEPSLENYLRIGIPLSGAEALGIIDRVLGILEDLHSAGFCHLFIDTRNIFYRSRGRVTLKDPALKTEFFHPLLELVEAPDFSYFSPEVMDGGVPGEAADIYAVSRLAERLLEEITDAGTSSQARALRWVAGECLRACEDGEASAAANIRSSIEGMVPDAGGAVFAADVREGDKDTEVNDDRFALEWLDQKNIGMVEKARIGGGKAGVKGQGRKKKPRRGEGAMRNKRAKSRVRPYAVLAAMAALAVAMVLMMNLRGGAGQGPVVSAAGGSVAVEKMATCRAENGSESENGAALESSGGGGTVVEAVVEEPASAVMDGAGDSDNLHTTTTDAELPSATPQVPETPAELSPATPVASFSLSPSQGQSPLQVYLDASSSYDPDGSITSYSWSCGGRGASLYHVFESSVIPASITITLTVTDDGGHSSSTSRQVTLF
jgi:PKD domain